MTLALPHTVQISLSKDVRPPKKWTSHPFARKRNTLLAQRRSNDRIQTQQWSAYNLQTVSNGTSCGTSPPATRKASVQKTTGQHVERSTAAGTPVGVMPWRRGLTESRAGPGRTPRCGCTGLSAAGSASCYSGSRPAVDCSKGPPWANTRCTRNTVHVNNRPLKTGTAIRFAPLSIEGQATLLAWSA